MANEKKDEKMSSYEYQEKDRQEGGQGRVAAGGHDKEGHPLKKDGTVDGRVAKDAK
jgi:hypothetical protein